MTAGGTESWGRKYTEKTRFLHKINPSSARKKYVFLHKINPPYAIAQTPYIYYSQKSKDKYDRMYFNERLYTVSLWRRGAASVAIPYQPWQLPGQGRWHPTKSMVVHCLNPHHELWHCQKHYYFPAVYLYVGLTTLNSSASCHEKQHKKLWPTLSSSWW